MKRIIKINYLFIILFIIVYGCKNAVNSYNNNYTLRISEDDSLVFRLGNNTKNLSYHIQYLKSKGDEYLAILNQIDNSIEIFNLNSNSIFMKYRVPIEGNNAFPGIRSFIITNSFDSVLLFSILPPKIAIADTSGHILKVMSHSTKTGSLQQGERPLRIGNDIFLVQTYPAHESNGILTATGQKRSFINITVNLITGESNSSELKYPVELIGKAVFIMHVNRISGYEKYFVYHFGLINSLFVTKDHREFSRIPFETNYKLNILNNPDLSDPMQKAFDDLLTHDNLECIYYDEFRECYYILIRKREDITTNNYSAMRYKFLYPNCFILILDKDFNHLGEVHFPDNTYSFRMLFINEKGIFISEDHINNPSFNEDEMRFRLFTLEKVKN